jgi:hypothetical protein
MELYLNEPAVLSLLATPKHSSPGSHEFVPGRHNATIPGSDGWENARLHRRFSVLICREKDP